MNTFFRTRLSHVLDQQWREVKETINGVIEDEIYSGLGKNVFHTKSIYEPLEIGLSRDNYKWIWKAKIPLKIKKLHVANVSRRCSYQTGHEKMKMAW